MLISNIVIIVMRIFSIQWVVGGILALIGIIPALRGDRFLYIIVPSLLSILLGVIVWPLALAVARFVTRGYDASVNISGLDLVDLYSFAFIFLGLYFMLSNLADLLNWFYYSLKTASASDFDSERKRSLYSLARYVFTVAAGAACLYNGRRWAIKLVARDTQA